MTTKNRILIRKAAVLGSGVMGSQIAAHFANANVEVILFDVPAQEGDANGIVQKSLGFLEKIEPSPLVLKSKARDIKPANYKDNLNLLTDCDLIIEAISERIDWKKDLYHKVVKHISTKAIFASNTSGLSIGELAQVLPENMRKNFCGVHFFNPPRYMTLVEMIPHQETDLHMLDALEEFLTTVLGKGVIRAKDTPNFIANRIGVFSMLAIMHHTEKFKLGFDEVDTLTGSLIGRAKSATYRTMDVVGIDTLAHVIKTMQDTLSTDPWSSIFKTPHYIEMLISKGSLGQKTGAGLFKKVGKEIQVFDIHLQNYRPAQGEVAPEILEMLKIKDPAEKFKKLIESPHPQAQFLWSIFRDLFHYCAVQLESIANNARDLDLAIRWGFGWKLGPFETWQSAGWSFIAQAIQMDIENNKTLSSEPLPAWVFEKDRVGVHFCEGSYSPIHKTNQTRPKLSVYSRQLYQDSVLGEKVNYGKTIFENEGTRLWTLDDEVSILSFKSKMHSASAEVLEGILAGVKESEKNYQGMVIWQTQPPFCVGANLAQVEKAAAENNIAYIDDMIKKFQQASMALKYSLVPTVAALQGLALGGGCEIVMHCAKTVAAVESYMGLVEVGVGLLPAGGGCKELVLRATQESKGGNIFPFLQRYFENVAMGKVSKSAHEAKELGFLKESDTILFNPYELLHVAIKEVKSMYAAAYRPSLKKHTIPVTGKGGIATLKAGLINMLEGSFISKHDYEIGVRIATIFGGGEIEQGSTVWEDWFLELEHRYFMELVQLPKTQERISYMLKNGKPLRN